MNKEILDKIKEEAPWPLREFKFGRKIHKLDMAEENALFEYFYKKFNEDEKKERN